MAHNVVLRSVGKAGAALWSQLPPSALETPAACTLGRYIHKLVCLTAKRNQSGSTWFLRNMPLLMALVQQIRAMKVSEVRFCMLGCSTGAEVYSAMWMIRSEIPQLRLIPVAIDVSKQAVERGKDGRYKAGSAELRGALPEEALSALFYREDEYFTVRPWIRQGIRWMVADARDPGLLSLIGPQQVVIANNFLVHMKDEEAAICMSGLARLIRPGGLLVCRGVDLDVRERVARQLGLKPVTALIEEIHDAEPDLDARKDWPWRYWSLEPMDKTRPNWERRYAAIFEVSRADGQEIEMRAKAAGI